MNAAAPVTLRTSTRVVSILGALLMMLGGIGAMFGYPWGRAIPPFAFILPGLVLTVIGVMMQKTDRAVVR